MAKAGVSRGDRLEGVALVAAQAATVPKAQVAPSPSARRVQPRRALSLPELLVASHPRWFRPDWRRWQWFERVAQIIAAVFFVVLGLVWLAQFFHLFG